jgi:ferredoxin
MLLHLFRQSICQPQKCGKCRIGVVTQPHRAELYQIITAANRTEHHSRKSQADSRFTCQARSQSHRNEMHHRLTADIKLSDDRPLGRAGKIFKNPAA